VGRGGRSPGKGGGARGAVVVFFFFFFPLAQGRRRSGKLAGCFGFFFGIMLLHSDEPAVIGRLDWRETRCYSANSVEQRDRVLQGTAGLAAACFGKLRCLACRPVGAPWICPDYRGRKFRGTVDSRGRITQR